MKLTIEQVLQQGVTAHKEGKIQDAKRLYRAILQSQPLHPDANHNLGIIAVLANQISDSLPLFKTALEANPEIEQFWLSYIDVLIKANQLKNAKKIIKKAKNKGFNPKNLEALLIQLKEKVNRKEPSQELVSILLEHYQSGRYVEVEKLAVSITQEFPKHQFGWKALGAVLKQTGRVREALIPCEKAVALGPQNADAHYDLGNTLKELGRFDEAELSYKQSISLKPDYAEAHNNLSNTLKELHRFDEAEVSNKQAIALKPDFAESHYNLGIMLKKLRRLNEAEDSLKKAIALKPSYAEAHYNLANTLKDLGRLDESEASYKQAIALKPEDAEAHNNLGVILKELSRLDEAEASFAQAIILQFNFPKAHNNLGVILKELSRLDEAEASFAQAIVLQSNFAEAHFNLANTLTGLGRFQGAEASYMESISLQPDYAEAHSNLGIMLQKIGRLEEAETSLTQATVLEPSFAESHNNLGALLQELGRLDESEASYRQAILLQPDFALAYYGLGTVLYINGNEDLALESIVKANNIEPQSKDFELMLGFMEARKSRKGNEDAVHDATNIGTLKALFSSPLILNRSVEADLIASLYDMDSSELDKTKRIGLLASGKNDARYGNGMVSPDFNFLKDARSTIQKLDDDLKKILMEAMKSDVYIHESFFNILGAGGGTIRHNHLASIDKNILLGLGKQKYSLVYYLSVGDQNCSEPGILKLYEPSEDILPCEGMIVIFPASRMHSSFYGGKADRIMIGINFYSLY